MLIKCRAMGLVVVLLGCFASGCSSESPPTRASSLPLVGANVREDLAGADPRARPVGHLTMMMRGGSLGCTGTLITDRHVLTAPHCLCDKPDDDTEGRVVPGVNVTFSFPPEQFVNPTTGLPFSVSGRSASMHPVLEERCRDQGLFELEGTSVGDVSLPVQPHEVAIVELSAPVPQDVATPFTNVFFGNMKEGFERRQYRLTPPFLVGYGTNAPDPTECISPTTIPSLRRVGSGSAVTLNNDPCDILELFGRCHDAYMLQAADDQLASGRCGDSGGPLFATRLPEGDPLLLGVFSGWIDGFINLDPSTPGTLRRFWAPTGDGGELSNAQYIIDALGGDADGDGVFDDADNCPARFCVAIGKSPADCANPDQLDTDGDGVGEVCDNCPASFCDAPGAPTVSSFRCFNPFQENKDGDAWGDACDLCPRARDSSRIERALEDEDGDGIGDRCDLCPGHSNPRDDLCFSNSECPGDSVCTEGGIDRLQPVTGLPVTVTGFCSDPVDSDGDGIPNACDGCPGLSSTDTRNANAVAEERERTLGLGVATLDDLCDPVPVVRVTPNVEAVPFGPVSPAVAVEAQTWLGAPNATIAGPVEAGVTWRHCSCFDRLTGAEVDFDLCVGVAATAQCNVTDPTALASAVRWHPVTMTEPPGGTPAVFTAGAAGPLPRSWQWFDDLVERGGTVEGRCTDPNPTNPEQCRTYGALFARVTSTEVFSPRDGTASLRDTFTPMATPPPQFLAPLLPPGLTPCPTMRLNCQRWLRPSAFRELLIDPVERIKNILATLTQPRLVSPTLAGELVLVRSSQPDFSLTNVVSQAVGELLGNPDSKVLSPVEPALKLGAKANQLATARRVPAAAVLSETFSPFDEPELLFVDHDARLVTQAELDPIVPCLPPECDPLPGGERLTVAAVDGTESDVFPGPAARENYFALLSGKEQAVYLVGGTDAEGRALGSVWRWSLADRSWSMLAPSAAHAPTEHVLGAAYDAEQSILYMLDVEERLIAEERPRFPGYDGGQEESTFDQEDEPRVKRVRLVRLYSYQGGERQSVLHATWPYTGHFSELHLAAMDNGELALAAGTKFGYTVYRFARPEGESLKLLGVLRGYGELLGTPVMGERFLELAALDGHGTLHYETLDPERFHRGYLPKAL